MNFTIKTYGMQELAILYFTNSTPSSASTQFKKWINRSESLLSKLNDNGYRNGQKIFTPKQVGIIVEYFGAP